MKLEVYQSTLPFAFPVTTSRGTLVEKKTWFLRVGDCLAEAPYFPGLSTETLDEFHRQLKWLQGQTIVTYPEGINFIDGRLPLLPLPWRGGFASGISFGLECLLAELQVGKPGLLFNNEFTENKRPIEINGLVWMDTIEKMEASALEKISQGFTTIKIKIGKYDWSEEKNLLTQLRSRFPVDVLTLRVDANGAYLVEQSKQILADLSALHIHSIEQPIATGQFDEMRQLCAQSPTPIALDEEIIALNSHEDRFQIVEYIKPTYLVLKPSLVGGLQATAVWIKFAEARNIGRWITSALETPIGLNPIAQFCGNYRNPLPQGLSTGRIYKHEIPSPTYLKANKLLFDAKKILRATEMLKTCGAHLI